MDDGFITAVDARPADHPTIPEEQVGVLLVNLGTPDAPTAPALRRYLREFLSDTRIVDLPRAIWLPILYGVILNVRPAATARNYAKIWRHDTDESPLRYFTRRQAEAVNAKFHKGPVIDWAMRYGSPSVEDRLDAMQKAGATRIIILPLYPQYSATTSASVMDAVFKAMEKMRWQPAIRTVPPYHDHPDYIAALAAVTRRRLATLDWEPERVLLSFHGLPERYFLSGDPYHCHCAKTARLLREEMGWTDDFAEVTFQSKFGREKWLEPATDNRLEELASGGVSRVAVITPGFVSDCIETLEEIALEARDTFMEAGGKQFDAVPCINDEPEAIALIARLIEEEGAGWLPNTIRSA